MTDTTRPDVAEAIWQLTLQWYEAEGVQRACLALQTRLGLGVSALFALAGLGALGYPVPTPAQMAEIMARADDWQHRVIEPLRAARGGVREAAGHLAIEADADALRKQLLAREVEAEWLQQQLVCSDYLRVMAPALPAAAQRPGAPHEAAATATARCYLQRYANPPAAVDVADLAAIMAPLERGTITLGVFQRS